MHHWHAKKRTKKAARMKGRCGNIARLPATTLHQTLRVGVLDKLIGARHKIIDRRRRGVIAQRRIGSSELTAAVLTADHFA